MSKRAMRGLNKGRGSQKNLQVTLGSSRGIKQVLDIFSKLSELPPQLAGALMSVVIAFFRIIYDQEETKPVRAMLECFMCGALSLAAGSAIKALGADDNWILFVGGCIGYLGPLTVRALLLSMIKRRIDK